MNDTLFNIKLLNIILINETCYIYENINYVLLKNVNLKFVIV